MHIHPTINSKEAVNQSKINDKFYLNKLDHNINSIMPKDLREFMNRNNITSSSRDSREEMRRNVNPLGSADPS